MARQRFIHPCIWTSDNFLELSSRQRLLFIGMFSLADDDGRIKANPRTLKAAIFPADEITLDEIETDLFMLLKTKSIILYEVDGLRYAYFPNWGKFQKPKYPQPSKLPSPSSANASEILEERFGKASEILEEHSSMGRDGLGREGKGRDSISSFENAESVTVSNANASFLEKPLQQADLGEKANDTKEENIPFTDIDQENFSDLGNFLSGESVTMVHPPKNSLSYPQVYPQAVDNSDMPVDNFSKCPHKEIISLYHAILPTLPKIKAWTEARKKMLKGRWSEDKERQNLEWWKEYFKLVASSDFLLGRSGQSFQANLEWLITPKNFTKVIEGNYTNRRQMNVFQSAAMKDPDEILKKFHMGFQANPEEIIPDYSVEELI